MKTKIKKYSNRLYSTKINEATIFIKVVGFDFNAIRAILYFSFRKGRKYEVTSRYNFSKEISNQSSLIITDIISSNRCRSIEEAVERYISDIEITSEINFEANPRLVAKELFRGNTDETFAQALQHVIRCGFLGECIHLYKGDPLTTIEEFDL